MCVLLLLGGSCLAQKVALANNLAYDALLTPNLSLEFAAGRKWSVNTQVGMNFFLYKKDASAPGYRNRKWSHWLVQPELRYWMCDVFNGWFVGLHLHGGQLNIGGVNIPFVLQNKDGVMARYRYEGWFYGAGLSVGYQWLVSRRFNVEASVGLGYARFDYDRYRCTACGMQDGEGGADYVGPTKASLSLIYLFK